MSPVRELARAHPVALSDDELMARIAAGSADTLGELYDRYSARALRVARSVCDDPDRAEHAVREAFVSIFKSRMTYQSQRGTVAGWVLTIVLDRAIDICTPDHVADQAGVRVDTSHVLKALAALPEGQREVTVLAYYGGMSYTEIAERLGVRAGTVKDRLHLGMQTLTRDLGP